MNSMTFLEYRERSEMLELIEGDCPKDKVNELPHMTKVHYSIENTKKLTPILGYVDEMVFERRYGRIAHLMKIPVQISVLKALMNFWDPSYRCFTFGDVNMTPTMEEYAQILNFPHNPHKVYFKQRIENTTQKVAKLLCLDQVNQYKISSGGFKWKMIESKLKTDKDKGRLREEVYRSMTFSIFGLVLFLSEVAEIINMEATNVFVEYEQARINPISAILAETFLSLNHFRLHGKGGSVASPYYLCGLSVI